GRRSAHAYPRDRLELAVGRIGEGLALAVGERHRGQLPARVAPRPGVAVAVPELRPEARAVELGDLAHQAVQFPPPGGRVVEELALLVARGDGLIAAQAAARLEVRVLAEGSVLRDQ